MTKIVVVVITRKTTRSTKKVLNGLNDKVIVDCERLGEGEKDFRRKGNEGPLVSEMKGPTRKSPFI